MGNLHTNNLSNNDYNPEVLEENKTTMYGFTYRTFKVLDHPPFELTINTNDIEFYQEKDYYSISFKCTYELQDAYSHHAQIFLDNYYGKKKTHLLNKPLPEIISLCLDTTGGTSERIRNSDEIVLKIPFLFREGEDRIFSSLGINWRKINYYRNGNEFTGNVATHILNTQSGNLPIASCQIIT